MTHDVNCPACDQLHTLQEDDIGRNLKCAACGSGFVFDEPLRKAKAAAKVRERATRDRAKREATEKAKAERDVRKAKRSANNEEFWKRVGMEREQTKGSRVRDYDKHPSYQGLYWCAVFVAAIGAISGMCGVIGLAMSIDRGGQILQTATAVSVIAASFLWMTVFFFLRAFRAMAINSDRMLTLLEKDSDE